MACNADDYKIVNCFGEALAVDISYSIPDGNPKTRNFNVAYDGDYTLNNTIKWNYGDGTEQTVSGPEASHTYPQAGNYTAIATITIDDTSCSFDLTVEVFVE